MLAAEYESGVSEVVECDNLKQQVTSSGMGRLLVFLWLEHIIIIIIGLTEQAQMLHLKYKQIHKHSEDYMWIR
jgi:hypothetical protein